MKNNYMTIIIGLGNPGKKFDNTRHNAGFMAIDFFAKKNNFPDFEFSKKYNALICKKEHVTLVKPQTFMNESGLAIKKISQNYKSQLENIIVLHDEIDLEFGKLKIVKARSSAGHKGVESIMQNIGNEHLIRFRIGIANSDQQAKEVVLEKFNKEEQGILQETIKKISEALEYFIENGLEKTMNKYN